MRYAPRMNKKALALGSALFLCLLGGTLAAFRCALPEQNLVVENKTSAATVVYVAFGSDSVVRSWSFCTPVHAGLCSFPLAGNKKQVLPLGGRYTNATISFGAPVTCGQTKAEVNLNNPSWYDIADVSLVDGFSNKVMVAANGTALGPPAGATGNEKAYGVYPLGCDICVAREGPPCGIPKGTEGCKAGTQYKPAVPCQWQGSKMGGGSVVTVSLVP